MAPEIASFRLLALIAVTALGAHAQTTWIVDAASGPGTDFTAFSDAVAAAVDGDTIRVRSGAYTPATIDGKALTVLGEPGAAFGDLFLGTSLVIRNVPAGERVRIAGFDSITSNQFTAIVPGLIVENVAGSVHLQDIDLLRLVRITDCNLATITSCTLVSLGVDSSSVALADCTVTALNGQAAGTLTPPGAVDVRSTTRRSDVWLMQTSATGAPGFAIPPFLVATNSPAITVSASDVTVAGDASDVIHAGAQLPAQAAQPAIGGDAASTLRIDPDVQLVPNPGAASTVGVTVDPRTPVSCVATGGELGGILDIVTISPASELVALLIGFPGTKTPAPPHGTLWLEPVDLMLIQFQDATGVLHLASPLPLFPPLTGIALSFQAVGGNSNVLLSAPTTVILR